MSPHKASAGPTAHRSRGKRNRARLTLAVVIVLCAGFVVPSGMAARAGEQGAVVTTTSPAPQPSQPPTATTSPEPTPTATEPTTPSPTPSGTTTVSPTPTATSTSPPPSSPPPSGSDDDDEDEDKDPRDRVLGDAIATDAPASGASSSTPGSAAAATGTLQIPFVGAQFHGMWTDYTDAERLEVLDKLAAAGITWIRLDLGWSSFEEHGRQKISQWYVDRADFIVDEARARGIRVLGTLWRTPDWANQQAGPIVPPDDPAEYGRFAGWAADHFRGRISAWEIWNEPNQVDFFDGSVQDYFGLLRAAYPEIKQADPQAQVVIGGPAYNDTDWLRRVYELGASPYFDVMATHPYQGMGDRPPEYPDDGTIWTLAHVEAVIDLMQKYGDGAKPVWFTEFGWSSHPNTPDLPNWKRGVTLEEQADYFVRTLAFVGGRFPQVTNVFWYNERNRDTGQEYLDNYGLLYRNLEPKPVYYALQTFLTTHDGPVPEPQRPDEPVWHRKEHRHPGTGRHRHRHDHTTHHD